MNRKRSILIKQLKGAFSLIEMLIVLTVLGVLFAVAAPNLFTLLQATSLSSEGNLVRNFLTQAQQLALSRNTDVEVRFFRMSDPSAADLEDEFRAFQFFQYDQRGQLSPASKFFRIKSPVYISDDPKLSTLLDPAANSDKEGKRYGYLSPSVGKGEVFVGGEDKGVSVPFVSFRFRADGSTDLPGRSRSSDVYQGGDTWFLTLVQGGGDGQGGGLTNYYTIQLDPFTGRLGVFRP